MKVCHFTSAHSALDVRIFLKECKSLAEAGHEVYIVGIGTTQEHSGVKIIGLDVPKDRFNRFFAFDKKVYKKAKELNCDIYHFHDPDLLPYGLKLKKQGKKVIFDSHEDVPAQILDKYWIPKVLRKFVSLFYKKYEKFVCSKFDAIVTATPYIANRFLKINKNTIDVKNYPILNDILSHTSDRNYFIDEKKLCYVGGLTEQRGITDIISAMDKCSAKLFLAGNIDCEYKQRLSNVMGYSKTEFCGLLKPIEVYRLFNKSCVGLCVLHYTNNHYNSLPIKMFEYMAAGLPVIASNFPLWKKIIEDNQCGICVEPENVEQIAESINFFLNNPDEAERMGRNGRRAVEEKYNWNTEKDILLNLYEKIELN
jgi:glycosyltransferase involved in cell wall biosynthesis